MVVVVRGGPRRRPVMTGLVVGGAVARNRQQKRQAAQMQQQVNQANQTAQEAQLEAEKAKLQAEAAKKEAERSQKANVVAAAAPSAAATVTVMVTIPAGVGPGQAFNVQHGGKMFTITCPAGVGSGQQLNVNLPAPQPVAVAAAPAAAPAPAPVYAPAPAAAPAPALVPASAPKTLSSHASSGRDLFRSAMMENPTVTLVLIKNHEVDENSPQMKQFGIISLKAGTPCNLIEGDLENGLGGAYRDYIRVEVPSQGGRQGMISRLVVAKAEAAGPPPALGGAPPPPAIGM